MSRQSLFQDVIMTLHDFWGAQGCLLWQPYNVQVGAGTGNPATLLRVLGPEPWRVAYVEPSIRPDDGRYGENPNRMQAYYQYQVILKPDPGNPQELYLKSLEAIGIDLRKHDVRFVEDNWKSPALGAWGLGWEVWLDGQEITQFTYFQQAGGIKLEPVSVEITYGVERIVLALQGKNAAWDIQWTNDIAYKDVFLQSEIEHCRYFFEVADVDGLKGVYDTYEREHQRALGAGLVIPAYDYVLKCSHLFNVLDARGAIGVTERAGYFRRMAAMTRNVAKAFIDQRQRLEYPMLENGKSWPVAEKISSPTMTLHARTTPADFVIEVGTEELPASDLDEALKQLKVAAPRLLNDLRLSYSELQILGTPRRLVILARGLSPRQPDEDRVVKGPRADIAFDASGKLTKAGEGFAKKQGIDPAALQKVEMDGGLYAVANVQTKGKPAVEVLADNLPALIASIRVTDTMRWNETGIAFSRPIRWILAMYGNHAVPFEYAGVESNVFTRGTRPTGSPRIDVDSPEHYLKVMRDCGIILSVDERKRAIREDAARSAAEVGGTIPDDPELLDEVANLVEQPTVLRGAYDAKYLQLPRDVLVTTMRKKQRYFAVQDNAGNLMPYFIAVRNGDAMHLDEVINGNEHVLTARFSDADFFFKEDRKHRLADRLPRLKTMTFQEKLGSLYDKNERLKSYVEPLGKLLGLNGDAIHVALLAAEVAKADQATSMVVEMTSLEGIMGREYARLEGQREDVATAILEHYLPRSAGDKLPQSAAGILLALADRMDSLVGLFAVGLAPTASADPFALRRAAVGILQIVLNHEIDLNLRDALRIVGEKQPVPVTDETLAKVLAFITDRLEIVLRDEYGLPYDAVKAVLGQQSHNPNQALIGVRELMQWVSRSDWSTILDSFARCVRITRGLPAHTLKAEALTPAESVALYDAAKAAHAKLSAGGNVDDFLKAFEPIIPTVTVFFDKVLVMDKDKAVQENRLALLQYVAALSAGRADLSQLSGF